MNYRLISKSSKHFLSKSANISCWWVPTISTFFRTADPWCKPGIQTMPLCPFHMLSFPYSAPSPGWSRACNLVSSRSNVLRVIVTCSTTMREEQTSVQDNFYAHNNGKVCKKCMCFYNKDSFFFTSSNLPIYSYVVLCLPCISLAARTLETLLFVLLVFESVSHSQPWTCILPSAVPKQQPDGFVLLRYELPFNLTGTTFVILWLPISQRTLHSSLKCHGSLEFCSFS